MQLKINCFAILLLVQISLGHTDHHGETDHDTDHHNTLHDRCISALKKKIFKGMSMFLLINSTNLTIIIFSILLKILQLKGLGNKEIKITQNFF